MIAATHPRSRAQELRAPRSRTLLSLLAGAVLLAGGDAAAAPPTTAQTMKEVYAALSALLPVAFSTSDWADPAVAPQVQTALAALRGASDQLREHGGPESASFAFLSQSLAGDARSIGLRVQEGRYGAASYLTQRMTQTCAACHLRLPSQNGTRFADGLLAGVDRAHLSPLMRAQLQVAARQFDTALDTYEAAFADPQESTSALAGELPTYLTVALRVRQDPDRAERGLARLAQRSSLPSHLALQLTGWRAAITALAPELTGPPSLERARKVLADGRALVEFPADGAELVHAVVASSLVYRSLEPAKPAQAELAQAFYLLGQTELYTRRAFELSDASHYLEQCIRLAPHTPLAERAYARLERDLVLGYTGSSGEHVPADAEQQLRDLRQLSQTPSGGAASDPGPLPPAAATPGAPTTPGPRP